MEQRLQKRIDYLQRILDTRFPKPLSIATELVPDISDANSVVSSNIAELLSIEQDDGMTDIPEDELKQRDEEEQKLKDTLQQIELDKLMKRKPRKK
jgi:hypothetical protein